MWIASREGGAARRLTSAPGDELYPKFSPDGKWIAFTGEYDGNPDVYLISADGGEPKRLTFHPSNDIVLGWTPDGKDILFRSDRFSEPLGRSTKLFLVSPQGGNPRPLPVPRGDLTSFSPDGTKIAYLETSQEFRTWKRYRGGWSLPIAIYDLKKNTYEELPKTAGMDMFPMWNGNSIYFISDRDGIMNLYSYDLLSKETKKHTDYKEFDVKWPSLGPDAIVYENGWPALRIQSRQRKDARASDRCSRGRPRGPAGIQEPWGQHRQRRHFSLRACAPSWKHAAISSRFPPSTAMCAR